MSTRLRRLAWSGIVVGPLVLLFALLGRRLPDPTLGGPMFHFFVVTLTCSLAVGLALLMLVAAGQLKDARVFFLGLAFLGIAGIFLVHALTTPGALIPNNNPWVGFSAHLSLCVGAIFLALSTIEWPGRVQRAIVRHQTAILALFVGALVLYGTVAMTNSAAGSADEYAGAGGAAPTSASAPRGDDAYGLGYGAASAESVPHATPAPAASKAPSIDADDIFALLGTPTVAWGITTLTIALLGLAIARYAWLYRLSGSPLVVGFCVSSIFLAQAQLAMVIAPVWHASWWEYHGLMLSAFGIAIAGLCIEYGQTRSLRGVVEGVLLRDTIDQLQRGYGDVIVALIEAVEAKDPYTRGHTQRVAALAVRIGEELRLSPERLRVLHQAALLHDIGKIGVSDAILNKPARLTAEEFAVVKEHPLRGQRIIERIRSLQREIAGVRSHHERLDGSGYPDGLIGAEIPLEPRIIAVADEFDALTSERAYRRAWSSEEALVLIDGEAGTKLDDICVAALHRLLRRGVAWADDSVAASTAQPDPQVVRPI